MSEIPIFRKRPGKFAWNGETNIAEHLKWVCLLKCAQAKQRRQSPWKQSRAFNPTTFLTTVAPVAR